VVVVAVVVGAVGLVAVFAHERGDRSADLPATVEWERVVASVALVSEEYQEAFESPERRKKRGRAMARQVERSLALAKRAQPRAPDIEDSIARLANQIEGNPDRELATECQHIIDAIVARGSARAGPAGAPDL
jgi:hypothetical protein